MSSRNGLAVVLRTLRAIKGVAQSDLPVDRKHLYKLESGLTDVSIKTLSALANSLGMMPADAGGCGRARCLGSGCT